MNLMKKKKEKNKKSSVNVQIQRRRDALGLRNADLAEEPLGSLVCVSVLSIVGI